MALSQSRAADYKAEEAAAGSGDGRRRAEAVELFENLGWIEGFLLKRMEEAFETIDIGG